MPRLVEARRASAAGLCDKRFTFAYIFAASHRLLADYDAIADAACTAWNRLCAEVGRITSLCSYPWIPQVRR